MCSQIKKWLKMVLGYVPINFRFRNHMVLSHDLEKMIGTSQRNTLNVFNFNEHQQLSRYRMLNKIMQYMVMQ